MNSKIKFGVVVFPGSNFDRDCFYVLKDVFGQSVRYVWHQETKISDLDCIVLPGGFSYGDYLRTGAIARFSRVMRQIYDFAAGGKIVIGICNGFQILLEAGLLPGVMLRNRGLHFICKHVYLKTENNATAFTHLCANNEVLKIPIAHNEGNYYIDAEGLRQLKESKQIIFRYCSNSGIVSDEYNPNGAAYNIAGIMNKAGNVLGIMPHPERSSESALGSSDGTVIFASVIKRLKER